MSDRELIFACWRSGQIEPADMVLMCREDPELLAMIGGTDAADAGRLVIYNASTSKLQGRAGGSWVDLH